MADRTKFYYPAFRRQVEQLDNFLHRHQADMVDLNSITDPELAQLNDLGLALSNIVKSPGWPKYRELA